MEKRIAVSFKFWQDTMISLDFDFYQYAYERHDWLDSLSIQAMVMKKLLLQLVRIVSSMSVYWKLD